MQFSQLNMGREPKFLFTIYKKVDKFFSNNSGIFFAYGTF